MGWSQIAAFTAIQENIITKTISNNMHYTLFCFFTQNTWLHYKPWEKDALHHVKVLHQHISLRFGAQVAHSVTNAQLDGTFQG